jgi:hypothetical protein
METTTTTTITLPVRGDGTALGHTSDTTFGLAKVEADRGNSVMYTPDPDNENKTIFWVRGIPSPIGVLPEGVVTLTLTYVGETLVSHLVPVARVGMVAREGA